VWETALDNERPAAGPASPGANGALVTAHIFEERTLAFVLSTAPPFAVASAEPPGRRTGRVCSFAVPIKPNPERAFPLVCKEARR
jgi:hypothetical protein